MVEAGLEVIVCSASGKEVEALERDEGVKHVAIPFTRKITPLQDLICLILLIRFFRQYKPQIVHTHTPKAGLLGMMAAWLCGIPVRMHTVAGLPLMESRGLKRLILLLTERLTYFCSHIVYPNSEGLYRYMVKELDISERKMKIIGKGSSNGIDTTFFSRTQEVESEAARIRSELKINVDAIVFSFVGRIVKDKGMHELTGAFRQLVDRKKNCYLLLVGPLEQDLDPLHPEVLTFLQQHSNVVLAGFQSDVRPWIAASDVFVFPSYREGFPNVVMQACCLSVACIVSDINGCNEIIRQRETGLIVPAKDENALYLAMDALAEDEAARKVFAQKARHYVVEHYDQRYIWNSLLAEYKSQLDNCQKRRSA
jgi:glycosyltransferase involved in cell wall biosynthesis